MPCAIAINNTEAEMKSRVRSVPELHSQHGQNEIGISDSKHKSLQKKSTAKLMTRGCSVLPEQPKS